MKTTINSIQKVSGKKWTKQIVSEVEYTKESAIETMKKFGFEVLEIINYYQKFSKYYSCIYEVKNGLTTVCLIAVEKDVDF